MPTKASKIKKTAKRVQTQRRSTVAANRSDRRPAPEQIGAEAGRIAENVVTELVRPVVRQTSISVSYDRNENGRGLWDSAARITGSALALSTILIMAPIMFGVQAYLMGRELQVKPNDLKRREYRDQAGQIHHHTRTFMQDHAGERRPLAT